MLSRIFFFSLFLFVFYFSFCLPKCEEIFHSPCVTHTHFTLCYPMLWIWYIRFRYIGKPSHSHLHLSIFYRDWFLHKTPEWMQARARTPARVCAHDCLDCFVWFDSVISWAELRVRCVSLYFNQRLMFIGNGQILITNEFRMLRRLIMQLDGTLWWHNNVHIHRLKWYRSKCHHTCINS